MISQLLASYGYLAVAAVVGLEDFGLPLPGETILIAASIAAGQGRLHIAGVALAAFVGAVLGDNIGYLIGRAGGRRLLVRWGRHLWVPPDRLERAESFFRRRGGVVVVIARFIEVSRQLNGIIAGTLDMPWPRFLAFNILGAALWVGVWSVAGFVAGEHASWFHGHYLRAGLLAIAVLGMVLVFKALTCRLGRSSRGA